MIQVSCTGEHDCRIRAVPNRSLTDRECVLVFGLIALSSLTVVGMLALRGIWMPLPFAGLELALLGFVMSQVQRSGRVYDQIDIEPERVTVRHGGLGRSRHESFQTNWLRVQLRRGRHALHRRRLVLSSHGRELEVGTFLNESERGELAAELRGRLNNESDLHSRWSADR